MSSGKDHITKASQIGSDYSPKTLVLCKFAKDPSALAENVIYRPNLSDTAINSLIAAEKPDIIVTEDGKETPTPVKKWLSSAADGQSHHHLKRGTPLSKPSAEEQKEFGVAPVNTPSKDSEESKDQAVLIDIAAIAINRAHQNMLASTVKSQLPPHQKARDIAIVGAGIESLLTGLFLIQQGHNVTFIESSRDFRKPSINKWETETLSVKSKGRHLNPTESLPFNASRKKDFPLKSFSKGGWVAKSQEALTPEEKEWQKSFHKVASEQPALYAKITKLAIAMNRFSLKKWESLLKNPEISKDVSRKRDMHRVFTTPTSTEIASPYSKEEAEFRLKYDNKDSKQILSVPEIKKLFPGIPNIEHAVPVEGESVDITQLVHNLITYLEKQTNPDGSKKAKFEWRTKVNGIAKNVTSGLVSGLIVNDGQTDYVVKADDYVISTGNAGNELLKGTKSHNKVQKLTGLWATIPNVNGIKDSFKVMSSERLSVCNITVSKDGSKLYVCGGHGYIGLDENIDITQGEGLKFKENFLNFVQETFPEGYNAATENGKKPLDIIPCDRPSTADGIPIIEEIKAENGKLIVNVGHNCGGFIIAPLMAWAIQQALENKPHILQAVCDPSRASVNIEK